LVRLKKNTFDTEYHYDWYYQIKMNRSKKLP